MITPTLKLFNGCTEGELIRFTEGGQTHWAVVGARGRERLMLLVLPLNSPPYCENILGAMDVLRPPYEAMEETTRSMSITLGTAMWVGAAPLLGHLAHT